MAGAIREIGRLAREKTGLVARPVALLVLRPGQPNRAMAILESKLWRGPDGRVEDYGLKHFPEKSEGPPGSPSGPPSNG